MSVFNNSKAYYPFYHVSKKQTKKQKEKSTTKRKNKTNKKNAIKTDYIKKASQKKLIINKSEKLQCKQLDYSRWYYY